MKNTFKNDKQNLISKQEGSPCLKCLIGQTCTKSYVDKTICADLVDYMWEEYWKKSRNEKENE